jgi:hypothetical protein
MMIRNFVRNQLAKGLAISFSTLAASVVLSQLSCCAQARSTGRVSDGVFQDAMPACNVIADSQKYDGKLILIRGLYREEPHGGIFFGRTCSHDEIRLRAPPNYKEDEQAGHELTSLIARDDSKPVEVVYRAVFHVVHGLSCAEITCFKFELEMHKLIAARAAPDQP